MNICEKALPASIGKKLIAACGMNCGLCIGYLREKNRCPGCNGDDAMKPGSCARCRIKLCDEKANREGAFCYECAKFPCVRLRNLDKRYRTKYGMSMMENLENIKKTGLERFVKTERKRWKCPECGGVICVHRPACIYCGWARS
jgi:hypothetical protein